jgi:hypothetical protein
MSRIRRHLTYSNVMVTILAFIVLTGGTAVALSGSNTVFTDDIANDTQAASGGNPAGGLQAVDLRPSSVGTSEVAANSLNGSDINESGLGIVPNANQLDGLDSSAFAKSGCDATVAGTGDMVKVGPTCIDKYEVSVWSSPTGGTQYGVSSDDYPCNDNGQDCDNIYARSVPGVTPSRSITWFQAQQALVNAGKRLPTNAEWQQAVRGTPDSTACNVSTNAVANTGANGGCVSDFGAFDMVGNLAEWVADWDEDVIACANWPAGFGSDHSCIGRGLGEESTRFPGALIRGGSFFDNVNAGPFSVNAALQPSEPFDSVGFRGAR